MSPTQRRRDFGPVPLAPLTLPPDTQLLPATTQHTDQCIKDAARWGFCNHTRLSALPAQIERQRAYDLRILSRTTHREIGGTLAFALLIAFTVWLTSLTGWLALPLIALSGLGWLLLFLFGLPSWLTADLSKTLPPDTRDRLNADLDARTDARRHRAPGSKRKGPFSRR